MSNIQKLIEKLKQNPKDIRYDIVRRVLKYFGYELKNIKGSHFKFKKENHPPIQIVAHQKKVKKWYIKNAFNIIFSHHEKNETLN